jgi:hypothetical protein
MPTGAMMTRKHGILPDTQAKPGVSLNHMRWAGDYFAEKKPDVIVHVGDHWDMPSLSQWDRGTMAAEGRAYDDDIEAGNLAMDLFMEPLRAEQRRQARWLLANKRREMHSSDRKTMERVGEGVFPRTVSKALAPWFWAPRLVFTIGNHEQRIMRHVNAHPELRRTLGYHCFNLEKHGWEVHDFLHPVKIDGISYQHYIPHPNTGKNHGGMLEARLAKIGFSFVAGHEQGKKSGERYLQNYTVQRGLVVGSYYLHDEEYKGPQGNHHWRGICMLHEVAQGNFDLMEVSLNYLRKRYHEKRPTASTESIKYVS